MNQFPFQFSILVCLVMFCRIDRPLFAQAVEPDASLAELVDPDEQESGLQRLRQMGPEELVELRRKKRQFDELSEPQKKQVRELHASLQSQPNEAALTAVMNRYYAWLRNLERDERNSLLDLPPAQRLVQIKKLHEERARKLFGTTGATKLSSQDKRQFIEWINEFRKNRQAEITDHFDSPEGRQILRQWGENQRRLGRRFRGAVRRSNSQRNSESANTEQRDNVRFYIVMEADPDFMAELIYRDIDSLLAKLSQEAIQILEAQDVEEQKLLVYNWAVDWARQISSTRGMSDDELKQFYDTLTEKEKENLDSLSPAGWRQRLEDMYRRQQRQRGSEPADDLPDENRLGAPGVPPESGNSGA